MIGLLLILATIVLFALAAFRVPDGGRVSFGWLGMLCWFLVSLAQ